MSAGHHIHLLTGMIDCKQLRKVSSEVVRGAVLRCLNGNCHNVSQTTLMFVINRAVICDVLGKEGQSDLKDNSGAPRSQPSKTPAWVED